MKKKKIEHVHYLIILFAILVNCTETPVSLQNYNGLWKNSKADDSNTFCNDWIPSEYHIKEDENTNGSIIYRVRILDPLACTDSYTTLADNIINFSQYNFNFVIRFDSDTTASVAISRGDSTVTRQIYKSNEETYWGGCL